MTLQVALPISRRTALTGLAASASLLAGPTWAQAPLGVVATTGMIADTTRVVGGDRVSVQGLMGPGVDPHAYRQTRSDIVALSRADLVLWHGLYLEAQMEDFFADLSRSRNVVAVADTLPRDLLLAHDNYADRFDPHVWMDPRLWDLVLTNIAGALTEADPEGAEVFAANAAAFRNQLLALADYGDAVLGTVPEGSRVLVTAHDAFKYFGRAHGFEVLGVQGISTESEAGVRRIGQLVDTLVSRNVRAVFVESSVSDRSVRALIEGAGAQGHEVVIGGELYSDAMGEQGTYEGTYLGMIDHNFTTIARALGGSVPDRGMAGLLEAS
jgi:manganese/zinc/iron transport system substrate-binding protein